MKQLAFIFSAIFLFSCNENKETVKDYVEFSGTINNPAGDTLYVLSPDYRTLIKAIPVAEDGTFADTLNIKESDVYRFKHGDEYSSLFLKNGFELQLKMDADEFDESISYEGNGSEDNNFLAKKALMEETLFDLDYEGMDSIAFSKKLQGIETTLNDYTNSQANLDSIVKNHATEGTKNTIKGYGNYVYELISIREKLPKGSSSPAFNNYENHAGGTTSLSDLQGKYVYVDVWATWCGPCKVEIPYLKEIEKEFHDQNIAFVSISVDREKDHEKWKNMVSEKDLSGIQLFADKDWESQFVKDYYISGIPRFILIDPDGNIVTPDAPRPSNPKLKELFQEVL